MINRYWIECVVEHTTHNGHKIYKDSQDRFVVRYRWGDDLGEDVNQFSTLKEVKSFIDRVVVPQWSDHLAMENLLTKYKS